MPDIEARIVQGSRDLQNHIGTFGAPKRLGVQSFSRAVNWMFGIPPKPPKP